MIGLCLRWSGEPVPAPLIDRFAASLNIGLSGGVGIQTIARASLVSTIAEAKRARTWQAARTLRGDALLFMGHIDNRAELRRQLEQPGLADDVSLYAAAYSKWGDAADLKVIGEFGTILWSTQDTCVRLSRSPFGGPALHIWHDKDRLIIATAARSIFATGEVPQKIDEQKVADSLYLNYRESDRGWFEGVSRLPNGCRALVTQTGVKRSHYYDLAALPAIRLKRDDDYVEAANALFEAGTHAVLDGFAKPVVSISGGFDSQAVAAFALQVRPEERLLGLSSVPEAGWDGIADPGGFGDESAHVKAFAALHSRFDPEWIDAAGLSFDHKLDTMFLLAGAAPRNAMNLHWIHALNSTAKARGCDVVLTGSMGNVSFSFDGGGALPGWFSRGEWRALWRELQHAKRSTSLLRFAAANVALPLLPQGLAHPLQRWRHGDLPSVLDDWCPLNPDYAREMRVEERAADMGFDPYFRSFVSTLAYRKSLLSGPINESGDMHAALATIHGIPMRDPTAYRPLVEFCLGIPDDQYLRNGQSRWLARRMLKDKVPDMVLNETRRGRQAADWHLRMGRQREALQAEVARLQSDPAMANRLNLSALAAELANWPEKTPQGAQAMRLQLAVSRGLTTARFIRYVEGRNDG